MSSTKRQLPRITLPFLLACMVATLGVVPAARASDGLMEDVALAELTRAAATPQEHAQAAKQYRLRAELLEAQAAKHEAAAVALSTQPPITHKFPSAFASKTSQEKQNAVQARRAAQEARTRAHWHLSRAVEIFFGQ